MYFIKHSRNDYQTISLNKRGCIVISVYVGAKHINKYSVKFEHVFCSYDVKYPNQVLLWKEKPRCYLTMVPIGKWKELNDIYYQWNVKRRIEKEREESNKKNKSFDNYNDDNSDDDMLLYSTNLEINTTSTTTGNYNDENDILTNSLINDLQSNYDKNPISSPIDIRNATSVLPRKSPNLNESEKRDRSPSPRYLPQPPLYDRSKLEITKDVRTPYSSFIAKSILSPRYTVNTEREKEDMIYSNPVPPGCQKPKIYNPISARTIKTFASSPKNVK